MWSLRCLLRRLAVSLFFFSALCPSQPPSPAVQPTRDTYLKLAAEVENALHTDVLGMWFPRSVDHAKGGFHSHFTREWQWAPSDGKFSVFQGRMTWVASQVVLREPKLKDEFVPIVHQGVDFLQNVMWDKEDGGFFWGLDDDGKITPEFTDHKHLYGIGFCIYGAAAAYQATGDAKALALAKEGFLWTDKHAHDAAHGGYFEWLTRDGKPVVPHAPDGQVEDAPVGPANYKSMNTHIHLLEAFTELYRVWPDPTLRARLEELLAIVRDKICVEPGVMNLYFTNAWQPIPGHDSYGHDVETAYLMLETDEVLHHKASPPDGAYGQDARRPRACLWVGRQERRLLSRGHHLRQARRYLQGMVGAGGGSECAAPDARAIRKAETGSTSSASSSSGRLSRTTRSMGNFTACIT